MDLKALIKENFSEFIFFWSKSEPSQHDTVKSVKTWQADNEKIDGHFY
jgi:hypothetical protein